MDLWNNTIFVFNKINNEYLWVMIFIKIKQVHTLHQNTNKYLYTYITCLLHATCIQCVSIYLADKYRYMWLLVQKIL